MIIRLETKSTKLYNSTYQIHDQNLTQKTNTTFHENHPHQTKIFFNHTQNKESE
jgi:hypothetical protein